MQRLAVLTARLLGFVELASLNPEGKVFFPNVLGAIGTRFNFKKLPDPATLDEEKGIEFHDGQWNGVNVSKLIVYYNGFLIDTQSSSDDSERILVESLEWAKEDLGIVFNPDMIYRRRYLSDVLFMTDAPILDGFTPVNNLMKNFEAAASVVLEENIHFRGTRIDIDFERLQRQAPIAPLTIQRRGNSSFANNRYYSEAPLPTDAHWLLLEQYENDLLTSIR